MKKLKAYIELARPFTLIAPFLGFFSGGICSWGAFPKTPFSFGYLSNVLIGSFMAATLNAASNTLNQIFDLEIDKINKPKRPIPSGRITSKSAFIFSIILYLISFVLAWFVSPQGRKECLILVLIAGLMTFIYSCPPFRTKRWGITANITIAIPRGILLKVAGWSSVKSIMRLEPWYIGLIFGLFLLGATSTKDFSDMEGDRKGGCVTLPIKFGVKKAAYIISPFFVFPFLLIPLGVKIGTLTGNPLLLTIFGLSLSVWGIYVVYLILKKPEELAVDENHISWKHMYMMMFYAQIGFALSYIF
ncbi:MAG: UbiA family prenyltransferase [Candidatus Aminicenantia bacterium]